MSQSESDNGNASLSSSSHKYPPGMENIQGKFWKCNYHLKKGESYESLFEILKETIIPLCKEYIFVEEHGGSGETPHFEGGFITTKDRTRFTTIQNLFQFSDLQKSKDKNWKPLVVYCFKELKKDPTHKGLWSNGCNKYKPPRTITLAQINERPWQKEMLEILTLQCEWDDRIIYWRWGPVNIGKTQFAKYLCVHHGAVVLEGTKRHMLAQVQNQPAPIYIVLLAYGDEMVSYRAIEQIKDGLFSSSFGCDNNNMEIRDAPHILIVGNEPPDKSDRNFHPTKYNVKLIDN